MKNIISIILVFALLASFAACKKLPEGSYEADTTTSSSDETISPELESFLNSFDTSDPDAIEQQFEQLMEEEIVNPEMEFGEDLIDDSNSSKIDVELGEDGKPSHEELEKSYVDIVNGETFTVDVVIKTVTNGEEMKIPVTAMRNGDELYFELIAPAKDKGSMRLNVLLSDDGNCYLIFPAMRAYIAVPSESIGEIFNSEFITEDSAVMGTYIESREMVIDGETYICEIYEDDGIETKYYYNDKELKRVESVDGENITIMQINEVSDKADASKFELPKYFDLATVMGSSGIDLGSLA